MKMDIKKTYDEQMQLKSIVVTSVDSELYVHFTIDNYGLLDYNSTIISVIRAIKPEIDNIKNYGDKLITTDKYDIYIKGSYYTEDKSELYFRVDILYRLSPLHICPTCHNSITIFDPSTKDNEKYHVHCDYCHTDIVYDIKDKKIEGYTIMNPINYIDRYNRNSKNLKF